MAVRKIIMLYHFSDLSDKAKEKVLAEFRDINTMHRWYDYIEYDAEDIGIKIDSFDIYNSKIKISAIDSENTIADKIFSNHGITCKTYQIAYKFKQGEISFSVFLDSLAKEYLRILKDDYDYLLSEKAIKDTIEINEYLFTRNGNLFTD